jgi:Bacterial protein of unknown function (DUF885)
MQTTRRHVLAGGAALGALFATGAHAAPVADAGLKAALDAIAEEALRASPEGATSLGLDTGARAGLKSKLSDASVAHLYSDKMEGRARLRRLEAIPRARLNDEDKIRYDAVRFAVELGRDGEAFTYGENTYLSAMGGGAVPYVVSQQNGAYSNIPEFLNSRHSINTKADCDAYLARMDAYARQLDQETARIRRDAGAGVIAPDFILDNAIGQITTARGQAAAQTTLVTSLVTRAQAKGISGDFGAQGRSDTCNSGRRRVETPAGRGLLSLAGEDRHDHRPHARRDPQDGSRSGRCHRRGNGYAAEGSGPHARLRRRAHECADQGSALPVRQYRRRPRGMPVLCDGADRSVARADA